jgi:hypothetical protein
LLSDRSAGERTTEGRQFCRETGHGALQPSYFARVVRLRPQLLPQPVDFEGPPILMRLLSKLGNLRSNRLLRRMRFRLFEPLLDLLDIDRKRRVLPRWIIRLFRGCHARRLLAPDLENSSCLAGCAEALAKYLSQGSVADRPTCA